MSSTLFRSSVAAVGLVVVCAATGASSQASAWGGALLECDAKYLAAKEANELNGQSWREFFKACRAHLAATTVEAPAATAPAAADNKAMARAPAPAPGSTAAEQRAASVSPPSPAESATAAQEQAAGSSPASLAAHRKQCEAEWKAQWAKLRKSDPRVTWDKYWRVCDKRLSAGAQ
jgi:hypothetical protein